MASYNIQITKDGYIGATCAITCDSNSTVCLSASCQSITSVSVSGPTGATLSACSFPSSGMSIQGILVTPSPSISATNPTDCGITCNNSSITFTYVGVENGAYKFNATATQAGVYNCSAFVENDCSIQDKVFNLTFNFTQLTAPTVTSVTPPSGSDGHFSSCNLPYTGGTMQQNSTPGTGANNTSFWSVSSSSPSNCATVNSSGQVVFNSVSNGSAQATIRFTRSNDCGSDSAETTIYFTKLNAPSAPSVIESGCVVVGDTLDIGDADHFLSSNTGVATVNSYGVITGVRAGNATIYAWNSSPGCGDSTTATTQVTVSSPVYCNSISASKTEIPVGGTATLTLSATNAVNYYWRKGSCSSINIPSNPYTSSITITGVSVGSCTITATAYDGCGNTCEKTITITVCNLPSPPEIYFDYGCASINCVADTVRGATEYRSSNTSIARINGDKIEPVSVGTCYICGQTTNSCGSSGWGDGKLFEVYPEPTGSTNTGGVTTIVVGQTVQWTSSSNTSPVNWSSNKTNIATVNSSGLITGVAPGTARITTSGQNECRDSWSDYNNIVVCACTSPSVSSVNINGGGTGEYSVCQSEISGFTVQLTQTSTPGTTINGCSNSGSWSSSNTNVATVDNSGKVTFKTSGTTTITYTLSNTCCGSDSASINLKVEAITKPPKPTLVLSNNCASVGDTDKPTVSGAANYSSSDVSIATVNASTGVISPISPGTCTISGYVSNECYDSDLATATFTVYAKPTGSTISGVDTLLVRQTAQWSYTSNTTGDVWSTSDSRIATVSQTGVVTAVAIGNATITVSGTNECGASWSQTKPVSVIACNKPTVTSVNGGGNYSNCTASGFTVQLTQTSSPGSDLNDCGDSGSWGCTPTNIATVNSEGKVTFKTFGQVTVTYTRSNCCGSASASTSVNLTEAAKPSAPTLTSGCTTVGTTTFVGSATNYSSSDTNIATVDTNGNVMGISSGSVIISTYNYDPVCDKSSDTVTATVVVHDAVNCWTITPTSITNLLVGHTAQVTLTASHAGSYDWQSNNTRISLPSNKNVPSITITGTTPGTATITAYAYDECGVSACTKTCEVTVCACTTPSVTSIGNAGEHTNCVVPFDVTLTQTSDPGPGTGDTGAWTVVSGNAATFTNTTSGILRFTSFGTVTVKYTRTTSCGSDSKEAVVTLTESTVPVAPTLSADKTCASVNKGTITVVGANVYQSSNTNIATVNNNGIVIPVGSGSVTISGKTSNECGDSPWGTINLTIYAEPTATDITGGTTSILVGDTTNWYISSYTPNDNIAWSVSDTSVAVISSGQGTGNIVLSGVSSGNATITASGSNACGDSWIKTRDLYVGDCSPITNVTLNTTSATLVAGKNETGYNCDITLQATPSPESIEVTYLWETSDESIASVSRTSGNSITVHALKKGVATITVTASDTCGTQKTATCTITVKNPNLTCMLVENATVTCGSTVTCNVAANPILNYGNERTESIVNITGWTATVTNGVDEIVHQGSINISKEDKTITTKGLVHGTGTTITITGVTVGLSDVTVVATDDNGVNKTVTFRVLVKSEAVDDNNKIATRGWINTYRFPIFGEGEDLNMVPRKTDIITKSSVGNVNGYLTINGTYENNQAVKEVDLSVSMPGNIEMPSGDVCPPPPPP